MAFTIEQVRTFKDHGQETLELLGDAIDSAQEYLDAMDDKEADDDDRGMAEQSLEEALDSIQGLLVSLDNLVRSM